MPDYQGIGLGSKFLNIIAKMYSEQGYDFSIITSAKNLINSLRKSDKWCMYKYDKQKPTNCKTSKIDKFRKIRSECYTASFMYNKNASKSK